MKEEDLRLLNEINANNSDSLNMFLKIHKKAIDISLKKFNLTKDDVIDILYDIILKKDKIKNLDGYIYTCLKNYRYKLNHYEIKKNKLTNRYLKSDLVSHLNSDIIFLDLISSLDKQSKQILSLLYLDDFSVDKISTIINIPRSTIYFKITKAYQKLYDRLSVI